MRHRNRKIQLLEQVPLSPQTNKHQFVQHDHLANIPMRICHEEMNGFSQLAEIFYQAIVTEPLINHRNAQIYSQATPLKHINDLSNFTKSNDKKIQNKPFDGNSGRTHEKKQEDSLIRIMQKQTTEFRRWRSQSLGLDKKNLSIKINHYAIGSLSTRNSCQQSKKQNVSPAPKRSTSNTNKIKLIKYSVIHTKKII